MLRTASIVAGLESIHSRVVCVGSAPLIEGKACRSGALGRASGARIELAATKAGVCRHGA
jgi:hypothetical protein